MRKYITGILLLLFLVSVHSAFADVPAVKRDCSICHAGSGSGMGMLLKRPLPELCIACHPDRTCKGEHPAGIKPANTITNDLPLDNKGEITCTTCHAPHGEGGFPKMLRKKTAELCISCHKKG